VGSFRQIGDFRKVAVKITDMPKVTEEKIIDLLKVAEEKIADLPKINDLLRVAEEKITDLLKVTSVVCGRSVVFSTIKTANSHQNN
jgi:hypothetical protein